MADLELGVNGKLVGAVDLGGQRREHLAEPVGRGPEIRRLGQSRRPRAPPAGGVGDDDVLAQVQGRFVEYDPAAWAAGIDMNRSAER